MDDRLSGLSRDGLHEATGALAKRWPGFSSGAGAITLEHREAAIETLVAYFANANALHGEYVQPEPRSTPITNMLAALVESNGGMAQTVVAQADQIVSMSKELRELREAWVPRVPRANLTV